MYYIKKYLLSVVVLSMVFVMRGASAAAAKDLRYTGETPFGRACMAKESRDAAVNAKQCKYVQLLYSEGYDDPKVTPSMLRCDILEAIIEIDRVLMDCGHAIYQSLGKKGDPTSVYALLTAVELPEVIVEIVREYNGDTHTMHTHPFKQRCHVRRYEKDQVLQAASLRGDVNDVLQALYLGANLEEKDVYGKTPLQLAAGHNKRKVVHVLLRYGANVDAEDTEGHTSLHGAVIWGYGSEYTICLLLGYGANIDAENRAGQTPLAIAKSRDKERLGSSKVDRIVQLLRDRGAREQRCVIL